MGFHQMQETTGNPQQCTISVFMTHLTYAYTSYTGTQGMRSWNLCSTFILKSGVSLLVLKNCIVCVHGGDGGGGGCGGERGTSCCFYSWTSQWRTTFQRYMVSTLLTKVYTFMFSSTTLIIFHIFMYGNHILCLPYLGLETISLITLKNKSCKSVLNPLKYLRSSTLWIHPAFFTQMINDSVTIQLVAQAYVTLSWWSPPAPVQSLVPHKIHHGPS